MYVHREKLIQLSSINILLSSPTTPLIHNAMSLTFTFPPTFHAVSQPLYDEQMLLDEHLEDERREVDADLARYNDYYADNESEIASTQASTITIIDPVSVLAEHLHLLAPLPEEDEEEIDTHSCADSGCQGEHTHADYYEDYETGHVSPSTHAYNELLPYCPATPDYEEY